MPDVEDGSGAPPGDDARATGPLDVHESSLHESSLDEGHPLHRPRHGRHRAAGVCALVFLLVPALVLVLGVRPTAFEHRPLVPLPSPGQGWGFLQAFPQWASDHLPLRQEAVEAADGVSQGVFGEPYPLTDAQVGAPVAGPVAPAGTGAPVVVPGEVVVDDDTRAMAAAGFPAVVEGTDGWLYYGYDAFGPCRPDRALTDVVARLDRLRAAVESSGRRFVLVVAPDKSTVVPEHLPQGYVGEGCAAAAGPEFWRAVTTGAGAVDLRPALAEAQARAGAPVYFPQDTHWTFDGGLVMAGTVATVLRPGSTATWSTTAGPVEQGAADLPPLLGRTGTDTSPSRRLAPDGTTDRTGELAPLQGPRRTVTPAGAGVSDSRVAVLGDSFLDYAAPYLSAAFTSTVLTNAADPALDPRQIAATLVGSDTVVVEVVQRYLASGVARVLRDDLLDALVATVTADPVR